MRKIVLVGSGVAALLLALSSAEAAIQLHGVETLRPRREDLLDVPLPLNECRKQSTMLASADSQLVVVTCKLKLKRRARILRAAADGAAALSLVNDGY